MRIELTGGKIVATPGFKFKTCICNLKYDLIHDTQIKKGFYEKLLGLKTIPSSIYLTFPQDLLKIHIQSSLEL